MWITAFSDRVVGQDDIAKLADGTEKLYLFVSVTYRDQKQKHHFHLCRVLQALDKDALQQNVAQEAIWQYCNDFSDAN